MAFPWTGQGWPQIWGRFFVHKTMDVHRFGDVFDKHWLFLILLCYDQMPTTWWCHQFRGTIFHDPMQYLHRIPNAMIDLGHFSCLHFHGKHRKCLKIPLKCNLAKNVSFSNGRTTLCDLFWLSAEEILCGEKKWHLLELWWYEKRPQNEGRVPRFGDGLMKVYYLTLGVPTTQFAGLLWLIE